MLGQPPWMQRCGSVVAGVPWSAWAGAGEAEPKVRASDGRFSLHEHLATKFILLRLDCRLSEVCVKAETKFLHWRA